MFSYTISGWIGSDDYAKLVVLAYIEYDNHNFDTFPTFFILCPFQHNTVS